MCTVQLHNVKTLQTYRIIKVSQKKVDILNVQNIKNTLNIAGQLSVA